MIDLVKALRSRATWETATGITEPSEHIDWMAADEITSLRGQVEALDNERNRLWADKLKMQGENARLREALKPFVPETQWIDPDIPDTRPIDVMVLAGELRAARAAITKASAVNPRDEGAPTI